MKTSAFKLLLFSTLFLFISCSKEKNESIDINEDGGIISRYQIVTIDVGATELSGQTFNGKFNGEGIQLSKTNAHELVFYVPENTPLGEAELIITSLGNAKVNYEVTDLTLSQSAETTLEPLVANMEEYGDQLTSSLEDAIFLDNHNMMMGYYNQLSETEKTEVAKFYQANKEIIDAVYTTDYSAIQGRSTQNDINFEQNRALVLRYQASVAVLALGGAVATMDVSNLVRPIAIGVAIAGASAAIDYHSQLANSILNVVRVKINAILGENNRSTNATNSVLTLPNDVATTFNFDIDARTIANADNASEQEYMKLFFTTKNSLNSFITLLNGAIEWANDNIPFFSTFPGLRPVPIANVAAQTTANTAVNDPIMDKFSFSISDPNLSFQMITLSATGALTMKVKIVGTNASTPINSTLDYTYADDFSSFSGSFPISVGVESVCGTVTDIDGNVYSSITIGSQCWTQSNLNVSHYRNGDPIPQVQDIEVWSQLTTGAWCYYENNSANGIVYGKMYNWYAVNDPRGLAPDGYHIPSSDEWFTLTTYLGGEGVAGGKLKSTTGWASPNVAATNETGFTALPGGIRLPTLDSFLEIGEGTMFWTSTGYSPTHASNRAMYYDSDGCTDGGNDGKSNGNYVRCIKD